MARKESYPKKGSPVRAPAPEIDRTESGPSRLHAPSEPQAVESGKSRLHAPKHPAAVESGISRLKTSAFAPKGPRIGVGAMEAGPPRSMRPVPSTQPRVGGGVDTTEAGPPRLVQYRRYGLD